MVWPWRGSRRILADALLARHLPGYVVRNVRPLGQGLENVAVVVNGELVVRWRRDEDAAARAVAVVREAAVLSAVCALPELPVAVPEPVVVAPDASALAYPLLPGCAALGRADLDPAIIGPVLGAVLRTLDGADFTHLVEVDAEPLHTWLAAAVACFDEVADLIPGKTRPRIEAFLAADPARARAPGLRAQRPRGRAPAARRRRGAAGHHRLGRRGRGGSCP